MGKAQLDQWPICLLEFQTTKSTGRDGHCIMEKWLYYNLHRVCLPLIEEPTSLKLCHMNTTIASPHPLRSDYGGPWL